MPEEIAKRNTIQRDGVISRRESEYPIELQPHDV